LKETTPQPITVAPPPAPSDPFAYTAAVNGARKARKPVPAPVTEVPAPVPAPVAAEVEAQVEAIAAPTLRPVKTTEGAARRPRKAQPARVEAAPMAVEPELAAAQGRDATHQEMEIESQPAAEIVTMETPAQAGAPVEQPIQSPETREPQPEVQLPDPGVELARQPEATSTDVAGEEQASAGTAPQAQAKGRKKGKPEPEAVQLSLF
jgi:hypothetical protein